MSITEFSQEMMAAASNFKVDVPCYIEPENILRMKLLKQIAPNVMTAHEHELSDALKLHDEMIRKSRAKRGMEIKRMWNDSKNLKNVLEEKRKDLETARQNAIMYEIRSVELQLQLNKLQAERKNVAEKDRDSKEIDRLKTLLDDAQKLHEERILMLQELYDQNEARIRANREIRLQIKIMAKQLQNEQDESLESDKAS